MLSNTNNQGNVEQNHNEVSFHTIRIAIIKKTRNKKVSKEVERREHLCTVGGNANWCSHFGKQHRGSSKY